VDLESAIFCDVALKVKSLYLADDTDVHRCSVHDDGGLKVHVCFNGDSILEEHQSCIIMPAVSA